MLSYKDLTLEIVSYYVFFQLHQEKNLLLHLSAWERRKNPTDLASLRWLSKG